jgi:hypothetical protein
MWQPALVIEQLSMVECAAGYCQSRGRVTTDRKQQLRSGSCVVRCLTKPFQPFADGCRYCLSQALASKAFDVKAHRISSLHGRNTSLPMGEEALINPRSGAAGGPGVARQEHERPAGRGGPAVTPRGPRRPVAVRLPARTVPERFGNRRQRLLTLPYLATAPAGQRMRHTTPPPVSPTTSATPAWNHGHSRSALV